MWRLTFWLICWLPAVCPAQLAGEFTFHFTNQPAIWDLSATLARSNESFQLETTLIHAPNGALRGNCKVHYDEVLTRFNAAYNTKGRVVGNATTPVNLNAHGTGQFTGTALGRSLSGPFRGSIALVLDATNRTLSGRETGTLCAQGMGCRIIVTNVSFQLPPDMNGTWSLTLELTTTRNAVRGTAAILLSNGRLVTFKVRGRYRSATGLSNLTLAGTGDALGLTLTSRLDGHGNLQKLGGKLFGQRLAYP